MAFGLGGDESEGESSLARGLSLFPDGGEWDVVPFTGATLPPLGAPPSPWGEAGGYFYCWSREGMVSQFVWQQRRGLS